MVWYAFYDLQPGNAAGPNPTTLQWSPHTANTGWISCDWEGN